MKERDEARLVWERQRTSDSRRVYTQCRNKVKSVLTLARRSFICENLVSDRR